MSGKRHIVISRTDSIGDVVLTLPLAGIIKDHFPEAKISFLGNQYTQPIIECCSSVDEVWSWTELEKKSRENQLKWLKDQNIDVFIHVFPRKELARLVKAAGIPERIGTSHRLYHTFTCNQKVNFTRKKSDLHEAQLNTKLLLPIGIDKSFTLEELNGSLNFSRIPELPEEFKALLAKGKKNWVFHPKSKGSASELPVSQFIEIAQSLPAEQYQIMFSGTEAEAAYFRNQLPDNLNIIDISGKFNLTEFIAFLSHCDGILAASTGPLHIGSALGISAIGLYKDIRPIHAGRWKPIGSKTIIVEDKKSEEITQPLQIDSRVIVQAIQSA